MTEPASLLDELNGADETGPHERGSVLDELSGLDRDGDAEKADRETEVQAKKEIGQELRMALKGNDDLALYEAIAKVLTHER